MKEPKYKVGDWVMLKGDAEKDKLHRIQYHIQAIAINICHGGTQIHYFGRLWFKGGMLASPDIRLGRDSAKINEVEIDKIALKYVGEQ